MYKTKRIKTRGQRDYRSFCKQPFAINFLQSSLFTSPRAVNQNFIFPKICNKSLNIVKKLVPYITSYFLS